MVVSCPKGDVWLHFELGKLPYPSLILCISQTLGLVFGWEIKKIWQYVLQVNCSRISELDVRLFNYPNWTSMAQVVICLPETV